MMKNDKESIFNGNYTSKQSSLDINDFFNLLLSTPWGRMSIKNTFIEMIEESPVDDSEYKNLYFSSVQYLYSKYVDVE